MLPGEKTTLAKSILRSAKYDCDLNKRVNPTYETTSFPGRYEQDKNEKDEKETLHSNENGEIHMDGYW